MYPHTATSVKVLTCLDRKQENVPSYNHFCKSSTMLRQKVLNNGRTMLTYSCLDKTGEWNEMAVTFKLILAITYRLMVKTPTDVGRVYRGHSQFNERLLCSLQLHEKKLSSSALTWL